MDYVGLRFVQQPVGSEVGLGLCDQLNTALVFLSFEFKQNARGKCLEVGEVC